MDKNEINKTIHEAMGLCWHEFDPYDFMECLHCKEIVVREDRPNPDYTSDSEFLPLWRWAKEQEWWDTFLDWYTDEAWPDVWNSKKDDTYEQRKMSVDAYTVLTLIDPSLFAEKLSEFMLQYEK